MCPPSVSEKKSNVCQWGMNNCLPTLSVWKQCTPPPSLAHQKSPLPFFSDCPTSIKCLKQNVTPSPYHAHSKKSTTLKHVKTLILGTKFIFYIAKLFLNENISKTIIKNVWQWDMVKIHHPLVSKKINVCQWGIKTNCRQSMSEKNAPHPPPWTNKYLLKMPDTEAWKK